MKSLKDMVTLNDNCFKVEEILIAHTSPYVSFFKVIECNGDFLTLQNIGTRFISSRSILKAMPKYENGQIHNNCKIISSDFVVIDGQELYITKWEDEFVQATNELIHKE